MDPNYNPFELPSEEALRVYANGVLNSPTEEVRKFLCDVQTLDGKYPHGWFGRKLTPEEDKLSDGFVGETFKLYGDVLDGCVKERISTHLDVRWRKVRGIYQLANLAAIAQEATLCRDMAIVWTLHAILPHVPFQEEACEIPICFNRNGPEREPDLGYWFNG